MRYATTVLDVDLSARISTSVRPPAAEIRLGDNERNYHCKKWCCVTVNVNIRGMNTPIFQINLLESELKFTFICAPGPGGQNVNKVATGVLLRFNLVHSALLAEDIKHRLINQIGKKLSVSGDIIIKAARFRSQAQNKQDALNRLQAMISTAAIPRKKRKKTKPSKASIAKRLNDKRSQAVKKSHRRTPGETS